MKGLYSIVVVLVMSVLAVDCNRREKRGSSSISLGPPVVYKDPGNHTVEVGQNFQFYCKIKANPLAHVAMKFNPVSAPVTVQFPRYGTAPTGGSTIVLLDLMNLRLSDEGRYTCFAENKYGTVTTDGWLKFAKACSCNAFGVAYPQKPCDDDGNCVCRENIGGEKCDRCQEGFHNFPFCQPCDCNPWGTVDQSLSCDQNTGECNCLPNRSVFDAVKCDGCPPGEFYNIVTSRCQPCRCYPDGSVSEDCDYISGQCECKENFTGDKCTQCEDGFYDRGDGCNPCECVIENTESFDRRCDSVTGQCNCLNGIDFTDTRTCASCPTNTYYDMLTGDCQDCGCDPTGTDRCTSNGDCVCKENFTGIKCDECEGNHYGYDYGYCDPCDCNPYGTVAGSLECDINGYCPCKPGQNLINYRKCDGCPEGQTISQNNFGASESECEDCNCHPEGALNNDCDLYTGECECAANIYGLTCDECMPGSWGLSSTGKCDPCACDPFNSMSLQCDQDTGQCPCYENIIFTDSRSCSGCPTGQFSKIPGTCEPCDCNRNGSISIQCDAVGQCACQPTVQGLKCDECKPGYYNFRAGGCDPCNCNQFGVVDDSEPCDPVTGQCNCKSGQSKISTRTCDGCPEGYYMNVNNPLECFSCGCHPYGSVESNCDLYTGKCDCGPNVIGDKCDECEPGFYGLNIVGIGECIPCECDLEGSETHVCDIFGQCQCKAGYGTINPKTCEGCPAGMYLQDGFCVPCGCDPRGSISTICKADGSCFCADQVNSAKCDTCESGYYFGDSNVIGCVPCGCDGSGTIDASGECDTNTGQCNCIELATLYFIDPRICNPCDLYQYNLNNRCTDCGCHPKGSTDLQCDFLTGQCPCEAGAFGISCDYCEDGYFDLDEGCLPCNCDTENTLSGNRKCDEDGQCLCIPGQSYTDPLKCTTCEEGTYQNNGVCSPCECNLGGSFNGTCDGATGQCFCRDDVEGRDCGQCKGNTYGISLFNGCKPCGCNLNGTIDSSAACDSETGQCDCIEGRTRYEKRTCDGCLNNFLYNEYINNITLQCESCDCLDVGSRQLNCSTYEGKCDCNPGITGAKCDTIAESQGDTVLYGELATLSCALQTGEADETVWIGPDGCQSISCGHLVTEASSFMSLSYIPEDDESYTCRFIFGDEVQDKIATVDVITFDLSSITVQKGTEVVLTATVAGLSEPPNRGIEWRHKGNSCTARKCKIEEHELEEEIISDEEYTLISTISLGPVKKSGKYTAWFKFNGKTFRTFAVVSVYECNCNLIGSIGTTCDSATLQCDCRSRYTGRQCDQCKDEFYDADSGCLPCDCDPDNAANNLCDKDTGMCDCPDDVPFIDTRRCEKCGTGKYLMNDTCVPCGCVLENTVEESPICADDGQCPCLPDFPYVNSRICERCSPQTFLQDQECVDCGCFHMGSATLICNEESGRCDCRENYKSAKCDHCKKEFYGPSERCRPCDCDPDNSLSNECDGDTGQCECIEELGPFVDPIRCGACAENTVLENAQCEKCPVGAYVEDNTCIYCSAGTFFRAGACVDCECDSTGSVDNVCDAVSGACTCNDRFEGHICEICMEGYYSQSEGCLECACVPENSLSDICDRQSGQCRCNPTLAPFRDPRICESCQPNHIVLNGTCVKCNEGTYPDNNACVYCRNGFYLNSEGVCEDCGCTPKGSEDAICNKVTGICDCLAGFQGDKCDNCQQGYHMADGFCVECGCYIEHTIDNENICDSNGTCDCIGDRPYIDQSVCKPCKAGYVIADERCKKCSAGTFFSEYQCADCLCNENGTTTCDSFTGDCTCNPNFTAPLCDQCVDGFYSDECLECACSPDSLSLVCDKDSGSCTCPENLTGRRCNQCADGYHGEDCGACECDPDNALTDVCNKETGQCVCRDGLYYKDTRSCEICPHHHRAVSGSCVKCEAGTELVNNECVPCQEGYFETLGICTECFCNPEGTATCNRVTGACTCTSRYTGFSCDTCIDGRYSPDDGCPTCDCDPPNSAGRVCDGTSGQCDCVVDKYLLDARTCEQCPDNKFLHSGQCLNCPDGYYVEDNKCITCEEGYYLRFGECEECRCNPVGSLTAICNAVSGVCQCDEQHQGEKCQNCQVGYYSSGLVDSEQTCLKCGCHVQNTLGGSADNAGMIECDWSGQCFCKNSLSYVDDRTCETCPEGQIPQLGECSYCDEGTHYKDGTCVPCPCHIEGSLGNFCNILTGVCTCNAGYEGLTCAECSDGYYKVNNRCEPCQCDPEGSLSGTCNKTSGQCECESAAQPYDIPRTCFNCPAKKYYVNEQCHACRCNVGGSSSSSCDKSGNCNCLANVEGSKCERCALQHYGINSGTGCTPCGCNEYGVKYIPGYSGGLDREVDLSCDENTGQCNCKKYSVTIGSNGNKIVEHQNRYESRTCDGCPYKQYLGGVDNRTCVDCNCHPEGSKQYQCDLYTGQCECNPQIVGPYCDTRGCEWGLWEYGKDCVVTDFEKCAGERVKTRKEFPSSGGDFSTIVKVAKCTKTEMVNTYCRTRECSPPVL